MYPWGLEQQGKITSPEWFAVVRRKPPKNRKVWRAEVLVVGTSYSNRGVGKDKAWKSAEARKTTVIWRVSLIG